MLDLNFLVLFFGSRILVFLLLMMMGWLNCGFSVLNLFSDSLVSCVVIFMLILWVLLMVMK